MDGACDPLNLLEQKVIGPLPEHSCEMLATAGRARTDLGEQSAGHAADSNAKKTLQVALFIAPVGRVQR